MAVDRGELRDRLRCAMTYVGAPAITAPDPAHFRTCLRSDFLGRDAIAVFPDGLSTQAGDAQRVALDRLAHARSAIGQLRENAIDYSWEDAEAELTAPRALLLFNPQTSLFDGAAVPPTHGFLNTNYFPPWDTWLDLVDGIRDAPGPTLVSWVPRWCRDCMDIGIAVDPAGCLAWAVLRGDAVGCRGWGKTWAEGTSII